jgi:hypothetical protein
MRKFVIAAAMIASLIGTSVALAAPTNTTGTIKSLDNKACTVTLDNNTVYHFGSTCDFSQLSAGEKVTITSQLKGTETDATKIVQTS